MLDNIDAILLGKRRIAPEFRGALRDAMYSTKELAGAHGVYTFAPGGHTGTDARSLVLVKLEKGAWKLYK